MAEHRALQVDLNAKLKLMKAAIAALPLECQAAAAEPDLSPFPARRQLPSTSPQLRGYYEEKMANAEAATKNSSALGGGKSR